MKSIIPKIFILSIILIGINPFYLFSQIDSSSVDNDTKEIYKLVIETKFCDIGFDTTDNGIESHQTQVVICDSTILTTGYSDDFYYTQSKTDLLTEFIRKCKYKKINYKRDFAIDYFNKNLAKIPLTKDDFSLTLNVNMLNYNNFIKLITNEINQIDWRNFYDKFPLSVGFIQVSQIGFSKKKDMAMLYADHWCNSKWGSGFWFILKKKYNKWKIIKSYMLWIS